MDFISSLAAVFLFLTGQDVVISDSIPLLNIGSIVLVIIGALSIFSFKNRKRQILLNTISIIINVFVDWCIGVLVTKTYPEEFRFLRRVLSRFSIDCGNLSAYCKHVHP